MVKLRVKHGQYVYLLEHRLPHVAKRNTRNTRDRVQCLMNLQLRERENIHYIVRTHRTSRFTGKVTLIAPGGAAYVVHHTDAMRV